MTATPQACHMRLLARRASNTSWSSLFSNSSRTLKPSALMVVSKSSGLSWRPSYSTLASSRARFTWALFTPAKPAKAFSTLALQDAQCIPSMPIFMLVSMLESL